MENLLAGTILDGITTLPPRGWIYSRAVTAGRSSMGASVMTVLEVCDRFGSPVTGAGVSVLECERAFVDARAGITFPGSTYTLLDATGALEMSPTGAKRLRVGRALGWFDAWEHLEVLERQDLSPLKRLIAAGAVEFPEDTLEEHTLILEHEAGRGTYKPRPE